MDECPVSLFSDNSSGDYNDLEVAAVMGHAPKGSDADAHCSSVPIIKSTQGSSPQRSSTVMTNIPRGNAATESPLLNTCDWTLTQMAFRGDLCLLKASITDATLNEADDDGKTPLMSAAVCGWIHVLKYLLEQGAAVDIPDHQQATALHQCCSIGKKAVAKLLIEYGASVDAIAEEGNTPLHYAVFGKHKDCVRLLLESGADLTIKNSDGLTPTDLAHKLRSNEMMNVFQEYILSLLRK